MRLFANDLDVSTCVRGTDDQKLLNASLDKNTQWCVIRGMEIKVRKTMCMIVSHRNSLVAFMHKFAGSDIT